MIGIDTNVLLRFLLNDDAKQSARAAAFMRDEISATEPGYVSLVVLLESLWVLESLYEFTPTQQLNVLEDVLSVDALVIAERSVVIQAVIAARKYPAGLQDRLVALLGAQAGCAMTVTFDKRAAKHGGMTLLR